MIPKVIHYCWFGHSPLPVLARKCIESWKKFLPDYEIREWTEENFDVNSIPYTKEAYRAKKFAFVSDYARFKILNQYGGLYFDTDVEVIRSLDDIIMKGPFMGFEVDPPTLDPSMLADGTVPFKIAPGLCLASNPGMELYQQILDKYAGLHFIEENGEYNLQTVVKYVSDLMREVGFSISDGLLTCGGVRIYGQEFFNPKDQISGKIRITDNTRTIHHFTASWFSTRQKVVKWAIAHFGLFAGRVVSLFCHNPVYMIRRAIRYVRTKE